MQTIKITPEYKEEIPLSNLLIADLPKYIIDPDTYAIWEKWEETCVNIIWLSYLNLVYQNDIIIEYEVKEKKLFLGLIKKDKTQFTPKINNQLNEKKEAGWLESGILKAIETDNNVFERQVKLMFDNFIGEDEFYLNPSKNIVLNIINNEEKRDWSVQKNITTTSVFGIGIQSTKFDLQMKEFRKIDFKNRFNKINRLIAKEYEQKIFEKFCHLLNTKIRKELKNRRHKDDD